MSGTENTADSNIEEMGTCTYLGVQVSAMAVGSIISLLANLTERIMAVSTDSPDPNYARGLAAFEAFYMFLASILSLVTFCKDKQYQKGTLAFFTLFASIIFALNYAGNNVPQLTFQLIWSGIYSGILNMNCGCHKKEPLINSLYKSIRKCWMDRMLSSNDKDKLLDDLEGGNSTPAEAKTSSDEETAPTM